MIQTPSDTKQYREQLRKALGNEFLSDTLARFTGLWKQNRGRAFENLDFAALSNDLSQAKEEAIPRLQELFELFKAKAEAAGAKVHLAKTAGEANRIIAGIARAAGARKIVKSKSMTAEETHLNDHLEQQGLQVTETDLGEWIIQLRHENPSHMVAPAVHCSRHDVACLFEEVTGQAMDAENIPSLVRVARKELRKAFVEADMGVTGANFAVAETGAMALVTNEGNGRLVTTLPRVHVALVGLEKLLPDTESAIKLLKVLPRSAAGQPISTYVTWVTGAAPCAAGPGGNKEMHIVFLDNGRMALSRDPVFSQALKCVRCGACANACPVWRLVGGHNYGHVYIGAIGLVLTFFYHGRQNARAIVRNCLNCQACKSMCPAGIDLPLLIKKTLGLVQEQEGKPPKNQLMSALLGDRRAFHALLRAAYLGQKPLARGEDMIRHLPAFLGKEHGFRSLPTIARRPLRNRWPQAAGKPKANVKAAFFSGCLIDFAYPEQGEALLEAVGGHSVSLSFPQGQTCCGLPAAMAAEEDLARNVAKQNLKALDPAEYDYVVTLCASCASHIKEAYPRLLESEPGLGPKAAQLAGRIIDFSSFMVDVLGVQARDPENKGPKTAYHAPCHLCRGLKVQKAPRQLMEAAGLEYAPLENEEVCCGLGGSYSFEFPEMSARILSEKLDQVEGSGAEQLVTDCPGCILQLKGGLDKRGSSVKVLHMAQAVAGRLKKPGQA